MLPDDVKKKYIEAGKIAASTLNYCASHVKVGSSLLEATTKAEEKLIQLGGEFAFPPQISLNRIAAHYCAEPEDTILFQEGDVVKIDVGAMVDGYIGDNALTVNLGDHDDLVDASRKALDEALKVVRPGVAVGEIGSVIQEKIQERGFSPVRNLSGHALEQYKYHAPPNIPNFDSGDKTQLQNGMVIAIEPFASTGAGVIFESSGANIFSQVGHKQPRSPLTRQVYQDIENYGGMPFTTRWLTKRFPAIKVNFALRELMQLGVIRSYPPLPDKTGGLVSQAEHTIIVEDKPVVTTRI
jgi:methionyl aminopeptidase